MRIGIIKEGEYAPGLWVNCQNIESYQSYGWWHCDAALTEYQEKRIEKFLGDTDQCRLAFGPDDIIQPQATLYYRKLSW